MLTLERLLAGVDALVLLQVVLEFKRLAAVATLELTQVRPVLVVGHVTVKFAQRWKLFAAHSTRLKLSNHQIKF